MSWKQMRESREKSGAGGDLFIKLKDGDDIEGVFIGEPYCFYQKFKEKEEYAEWAEGRAFKFKINFAVKEDGKWKTKIFQQSKTTRDVLLDCVDEYGLDCIFKIKRTGSTKDDTRYAILFKGKISEKDKEEIDGLKIYPLTKNLVSKKDDRNIPPPTDDDAPPPFDEEGDIPF